MYIGGWVEGKMEGRGRFYQGAGRVSEGIWRDGKRVEGWVSQEESLLEKLIFPEECLGLAAPGTPQPHQQKTAVIYPLEAVLEGSAGGVGGLEGSAGGVVLDVGGDEGSEDEASVVDDLEAPGLLALPPAPPAPLVATRACEGVGGTCLVESNPPPTPSSPTAAHDESAPRSPTSAA